MRRKMSKEVAKSEMLSLRKDGYSNTEIAEQLECCYATVLKYIGKGGVRRSSKPAIKEPKTETIKPESRLKLMAIRYDGGAASFELRDDCVSIAPHCPCLEFERNEFEEFAKDILAVSQIVRHGDGIRL